MCMKKNKKNQKQWVYQRNKNKSLLLYYQPSFPGEKTKKHAWNKTSKQTNETGLPTKQNKSLLLHYQPSLLCDKTKTNMLETNKQKKPGLPTKENKNLLLHYQPSFPGERTKKFKKYFIAYTFMPTTSLKHGYYDKSKINPHSALFFFQPVHIIFFNFCIIPVHSFW